MLPKINRIAKKTDFDRIFKKGTGSKQGFLLLKVASGNSNETRFAFIVGKKVSNKATVRNKIRRQLSKLTEDKIKKGIGKKIDGVFVVLPGFEKNNFAQIKKDFEKLLEKSKII